MHTLSIDMSLTPQISDVGLALIYTGFGALSRRRPYTAGVLRVTMDFAPVVAFHTTDKERTLNKLR